MREQKIENPEINSQAREKKRGRPPGRKNSSVREDRKEACRAVAAALVKDPAATVINLAWRAFLAKIVLEGGSIDSKAEKKAHERARQALATLVQLVQEDDTQLVEVLGDNKLVAEVREALAKRREHMEWRRRVRERARREREERFHLTPARILLGRLLRFPEVRQEFAAAVRERRRQLHTELCSLATARETGAVTEAEYTRRIEELTAKAKLIWAFALAPDQVTDTFNVVHFRVGYGSSILTSTEVFKRINMELTLQRRAASLATIPLSAAKSILETVKTLRKAAREKDSTAEAAAREKLHSLVSAALNEIGWADPELPACQMVETPAARAQREETLLREVVRDMYADLPVSLERTDTERWPEPWSGPPLQLPEDWQHRPRLVPVGRDVGDLDGDDDEAAEVAREAAGMTTSDTLTIGAGRVKNGGSRTDITTAYNMLS